MNDAQKKLILVCNAHLDPVWLWQWQEGLAETLTTFRTAAEFCEEYDGFVFNHNEALLYKWVEEYEPELFGRIKRLVSQAKWHIMGGWYLQPDCNLPAGESLVRQIVVGKNYFREKFGVEPEVAINFDPFGHTRGLVQILKKSGYSGYLFCRPDGKWLELPDDDFIWAGYDGSEIIARRASDHYNTYLGKAGEKIENWLKDNAESDFGMILWGIGNHGGGPSRLDLENIKEIQRENPDWEIVHGKPEDYFNILKDRENELPKYDKSLNPWAVGCYTSMAEVKHKHRHLENEFYSTEKTITNAWAQGLMEYPQEQLQEVLEDMLFCEFHDVLPGTAIRKVEEYALQRLYHGLEICSRLKSKAFFKLLAGEAAAEEGEFPIYVYNHHPYDVEETIVAEFQPPEPNFERDKFLIPKIYDKNGEEIPFQLEKEGSNILDDHRKRVVFRANLKASSMNLFPCFLNKIPKEEKQESPGNFHFKNDRMEFKIDKKSGLPSIYKVDGKNYLKSGAFKFLVMKDYPDPWGMRMSSFSDIAGDFRLMNEKESAAFAGIAGEKLKPVRIIEDGAIRTVVEALFKYNHSAICVRYKIPKEGAEIEIEADVHWNEKDKMLKLAVPKSLKKPICIGQTAYGRENFESGGNEKVAQKWLAIISKNNRDALTIINDRTYGFDIMDGELRLSLLRSPAYAGHPVEGNEQILRQDRYEPRIDQGRRKFRFWMNAGKAEDRLDNIDMEAQVKAEFPMALCCYPSGGGNKAKQGIKLSDSSVIMSTLKKAENDNKSVLRLFEATGIKRDVKVEVPVLEKEIELEFTPFEIKTVVIDPESGHFEETNILERSYEH